MRFLCLGYYNPADFAATPQAERDQLMEKCYAQCIPLRETGQVLAEEGLGAVSSAKCIRTRGGRALVTDGPFLEVKEQLGSYFIVEAEDIDEAVRIASLHPGAVYGEEFGFGIEVRPIRE